MNFLGMGPMEVIIVLLVAFIFLGPERMIDAARMLGKGMNELRRLSAELPRLDLEEDIFPSDGRPGRSPSAPTDKGVYRSQPPQDSERGDGMSPSSPETKDDEPDDEAPVAFSRGASARAPDAGETAASEETN